jgi:hypothetical protein
MIKKNSYLLMLFCLFALMTSAHAAKLYKWVDENGNISFSDKLPPKDSRREREELNKEGRTIAVKDAALTPEQLEQKKKITTLQETKKRFLKT